MRRSQPGGLIGVRAGVAAFAVLAALAWPAVGYASEKVIENPSGPLSSIFLENDLDCQVLASGDTSPTFFGGTEEAEPGGCGTFLALKTGEGPEESKFLWGPNPSAGSFPEGKEVFTPVGEQTIEVSGTTSKVTTIVTADVPNPEGAPTPEAELTETDSYVTGQESYETTIKVKNIDANAATLRGALYHVGDCYLADHDAGYGAVNVPFPGSVACTVTPNDLPAERLMAFTPIATTGFPVSSAHYVESHWPSFWEYMKPDGEQLPDTTDATTNEDNGMGLSWPIELGPPDSGKEEATLKLTTTLSAYGAPTSSSSISASSGVCVANGQIPVTVSAPNGAKAVDYVLDGTAGSVETNATGQATITLTPGQHTLEYWGEDQAGAQETTHHTLNVTVASGGPTLTITSEQGKSSYLAGEAGSVAITATGPGLTSNPSATNVALSTAAPGSFLVTRSAADACGTTSASFAYTVARRTLGNLPPPVLGKTVNVEPVSGEVFVKLPATASSSAADESLADPLQSAVALATATESLSKGIGFVPLREARQIPVGSVLETTGGVARIATATSTPKAQQFGNFGAGIFKLLQNRKQKGLTDLIDNHSASQVCTTVGKGRALAAKHLSSKTLGRVDASAHGRFSVHGQYSAATVRGTVWNVSNRCEGTLTHVTRGVVSVRDFRRRKTITLFTGQSYLARGPVKR
jgi:hypothetical protein